MVREGVFDAEFAEPAIGEVHLYLTTDQPFRADRKDIPHDQHPDHQFRIDRRATHGRIMRCKFTAKPGKIESGIDLPHQMIFRNRLVEMKLVEQLTLVTLQTAHHGSTSPRFASTQRNHASWPVSTDFCNKIGTFETCRPYCGMSVDGGKAENIYSWRVFRILTRRRHHGRSAVKC